MLKFAKGKNSVSCCIDVHLNSSARIGDGVECLPRLEFPFPCMQIGRMRCARKGLQCEWPGFSMRVSHFFLLLATFPSAMSVSVHATTKPWMNMLHKKEPIGKQVTTRFGTLPVSRSTGPWAWELQYSFVVFFLVFVLSWIPFSPHTNVCKNALEDFGMALKRRNSIKYPYCLDRPPGVCFYTSSSCGCPLAGSKNVHHFRTRDDASAVVSRWLGSPKPANGIQLLTFRIINEALVNFIRHTDALE